MNLHWAWCRQRTWCLSADTQDHAGWPTYAVVIAALSACSSVPVSARWELQNAWLVVPCSQAFWSSHLAETVSHGSTTHWSIVLDRSRVTILLWVLSVVWLSEVRSEQRKRHFFHLVVGLFHEYFINQKLHTWLLYVADIYSRVEFSRDPSRGFFSPYVRNCASKCLLGFFFVRVLPTAYSLDAWTDFHA